MSGKIGRLNTNWKY